MTGLVAAIELGQDWLWHALLIFLRVGPAMSLAPGFGEQSLPVRIKLVAALAITVILSPIVPLFSDRIWESDALIRFLATETITGLLIGISLRMFVFALQIAGSIAAQSTSLSQILGASAEPMPAMGQVLMVAGLALIMAQGFHVQILINFSESYDLFPPGQMPFPAILSEWGGIQATKAFKLAFQLAAPFAIVSLLYNLALGAINRGMPQLMVAFVGAPAITAAGLILLAILAPVMLSVWAQELQSFAASSAGGLP